MATSPSWQLAHHGNYLDVVTHLRALVGAGLLGIIKRNTLRWRLPSSGNHPYMATGLLGIIKGKLKSEQERRGKAAKAATTMWGHLSKSLSFYAAYGTDEWWR